MLSLISEGSLTCEMQVWQKREREKAIVKVLIALLSFGGAGTGMVRMQEKNFCCMISRISCNTLLAGADNEFHVKYDWKFQPASLLWYCNRLLKYREKNRMMTGFFSGRGFFRISGEG
jgi:hypothetical protein